MKKSLLLVMAVLLFSACNAGQPDGLTTSLTPTYVPTPTPTPSVVIESKTVDLLLQNKSGEQGTALLEDIDGKLRVTLTVTGEPKGVSQPAHIHAGLCPTPGAVKYPLTNVVNGQSVTMIDVTMAELLGMGDLAINVHKSAASANVYVACGDVR